MRTWLVPVVVALVAVWVWWIRRTWRTAYLERLVAAANGSPARARRVTLIWQSVVAAVGVLFIGLAMVAQVRWSQDPVRIALLVGVIALVVPLGSIAGGRDASAAARRRVHVRRSVQDRLGSVGASPEVADVVVRTSKPFTYASFLMGVLAAVLLVWHD